MKNLKALIKSYKNEAKSDWAIAEDMADMKQFAWRLLKIKVMTSW